MDVIRKLLICLLAVQSLFLVQSASAAAAAASARSAAQAGQQQKKVAISGKVVDEAGEPVIGAVVMDTRTSTGVQTDFDGKFTLSVTEGADVKVTCIGYGDYIFRYSQGQKSYDIVLKEENQMLEELVVTAFATQKKVNVTGAITAITGDDVIKAPVANVSSALVGITPGISAVTVSGEPGQDAAEIAVRGISSYSGNTAPLIVIDGIEQPASQAVSILNGMNPNDILGISVLKDASSTAVYGIRAANGVIIVTTRRGQAGAPKVSFSGNFGLTSATNVQRGLSSYEYALFRNEAIENEVAGFGKTPLRNYLFTDDDLWKFQNNRDFTPDEVAAMNITDAQRQQLLNSPALYYGTSDAYAELYSRTAPQWQANVSVSGGAERVKYYVSLNYFDQQSIMQNANYFGVNTGSRYQRYNVRANIDIDLFKHTTLFVNTSGQFSTTTGPGTGSLYSRYSGIMQIIYEGNPFTNRSMVIDDHLVADFDYPQNSVQEGLHRRTDNEMTGGWLPALLGRSVGTTSSTLVDVTLRLRHDMSYLLEGLDFQTSVRYQENYSKVAVRSFAIPQYTVRRSLYNPNELEFFGGTVGSDGYSSGSWGGMRDFYADATLNYHGVFGKHSVGGLLLGRATKYTMPGDQFNTPSGLIGTSARVTYDYDTRYMLEANFAYNGTENFAKGHRFGFFPAFSVGYAISNEPFFPKNNFLTFMKIRGSYGIVGNDQIGGKRYLYLPGTFSTNLGPGGYSSEPNASSASIGGNYYQFGRSEGSANTNYYGSAEGALGNPNVTWEKSRKTSAGLELRFFRDRLSFTGDYFYEDRTHILTTLGVIPATFGVPSWNTAAVNVGEVTNKGYEIVLGWKDKAGDFGYYIEGNLTYAKNTIVYMAEAPNPYEWMNQTGHSIGQRYGYKTDGFYDTVEELGNRPYIQSSANSETLGDIKYLDLNGDGTVNDKDMGPVGYPNRPLMNFGGKLGFSWKGLDLNVVLSGTAMGSYYISRITSPFFKRAGNAFLWQYEGRWTAEKYAAGQTITYPRAVYDADQNHYDFGPVSDFWALSSDHLRIKNVELGYSFPENAAFLRKAGISGLRVYANANNLLTLFDEMSRYGIDPETKDNLGGSEGNISYVFPLTRTVNLGFNIQF